MLVDLLPLVVVVRVQLPERPGDRLRGFVGFEPRVEDTFALDACGIAQALITQHQVVVRLEILGVDGQHLLEGVDRRTELALEEEHASELVQDDAVARVLGRRLAKRGQRFVVPPEVLEDGSQEEVRLGELRDRP